MKLYYYLNNQNKIVNLFDEQQYQNFILQYPNLNVTFFEIEKEGNELAFLLKYSTFLKLENGNFILDEDHYNGHNTKALKISRIKELKTKLIEGDYKVIKCYEAQLLNEDMPYNLQDLLQERKAWREEINTLEFELSMLT